MFALFIVLGLMLAFVIAVFFIGIYCLIVGVHRSRQPIKEATNQNQAETMLLVGCMICGLLFPLFVLFASLFVPIPPFLQDALIIFTGGGPFVWGTLSIRAHLLYGRKQKRFAAWAVFSGGLMLVFGTTLAVLIQSGLPSWFSHIFIIMDVIGCSAYLFLLNYWDNK